MSRSPVRFVIGTLILLAVTPPAANAQFGMLKKLKNSISPDSAAKLENAKNDSIALAAKLAVGDTTPLGRSKFSRVVSAAGAASEKFEAVTGVSAKDAALAATGVGATNIIAKKMGVDPMSLGTKAFNLREQGSGQVVPGNPAGHPWMGFTEADARAIAAFQQEMMQVAMAASGGDLAAQARLERWQAIAVKYEPEIEKLSVAASGGDMTAVQRLQVIQIDIIKEWANTGTLKSVKPVKPMTKAAAKPVKAAKP
jgi:hypothetical protein